jgi:hypothetical protein
MSSCFIQPQAFCRMAAPTEGGDAAAQVIANMKARGVKIYGSHGCHYCRKILAEHPHMSTLFEACGDNGKACVTSDGKPVEAYPTTDFGGGHVVRGYKPLHELQAAFEQKQVMTRPKSPPRPRSPPRKPRIRTVENMILHGVKFFGTPACHYCQKQKKEHPLLERMFQNCSGGDCITSAGTKVRALPTWDFGHGNVHPGFLPLEKLLDLHMQSK